MKKLAMYPELAADYYQIIGSDLYRKLANGGLFKVQTHDRSRLVTTFAGEVYRALDIAWVLHQGYWTKRKVISLNGDPFDMSLQNVVAVRNKVYRCYIIQHLKHFTHGLSKNTFATNAEAYADWSSTVQHIYRTEMPIILREEAWEREIVASNKLHRARPADFPAHCLSEQEKFARSPKNRPARPSKKHVWSGKDWVIVPKPINVADDYKVRAARIMEGYSVFEYDASIQQVVVRG